MRHIELPKTLETSVSWKYTLPGIDLTAGVSNRFTLSLIDNPDAAKNQDINASYYTLTIREICDIERIVGRLEDQPINKEDKKIVIDLELASRFKRGYYRLHFVFKDENKNPISVYEMYGVVDKHIDPTDDDYMTLESVRVQLGDLSISDNKLLESLEVGTGDIASGVERAIQQWNNRAPIISKYTGSNFPYPEILRCGTIYFILQSIWTQLERNRLGYQAEGMAVDLEKRADKFATLMQQYQTMWIGGMSQVKNEENINMFSGSYHYS
jgi:hypothetical protein